ncbi:heptaprenylglyceryl phosphate synthase [Gorillibacterium sp. sgz500922]|uniref:heptaprenylglyceryl phosphate synthase n=1 Tax=Gorillibacterium sp. sgz500922 TaxID=3446694 RepID=UPI003F6718E8
MKPDYTAWRHVFKLDPDKSIDDAALEQVCRSGTDAVVVGGSSGITYDNTAELLARVRAYEVACALELSDAEAAVPGFDLYLLPVVLNTPDGDWITGLHQKALRHYADRLDWERIVPEGYVILNPRSMAARVSGARKPADAGDLRAFALLADRIFRMPIFYVEYSGAWGDMAWVREAKAGLNEARLFYGGGIRTPEQAEEAAAAADTIVVGNLIYENLPLALATVPGKRKRIETRDNEWYR